MQVYHYTTISALALILHSKRIRFSRLDTLDDVRETAGIPSILPYSIYVSCWTLDEKENIVLWDMYTRTRGIRIELPREFYNDYKSEKKSIHENLKDHVFPLPEVESETKIRYFQTLGPGADGFSVKVEYCSDAEVTKLQQFELGPGSVKTSSWSNLVKYKDDQWSFQQEFRYFLIGSLYYAPNPMPDYVDVPINDDVLNNIKIRLHPNAEPDSKLIVQALLEKYTTAGSIETSHLTGIIRSKNRI